MIYLAEDTINKKDIDELIKWLSTYPRLTKGKLTVKLEERFAEFIGTKHSVFVNSGSSANLLMIHTLLESGYLEPKDKVIVPALSWVTDLTPILQLGLDPILCDCNLDDLSIDINQLEKILDEEEVKAIIIVSVLGLVPNMEYIKKICKDKNIFLLEDVCESLGSKFNEQNLGAFGHMSTFSTYFGHHISTIEGGFVCTNDNYFANVLRSVRSHGWGRDLDEELRNYLENVFEVNKFNALFTFYHSGLNCRSTDLQAFIGLKQLKKLDYVIKKRNENFYKYIEQLDNNLWKPKLFNNQEIFISNFAYPLISYNRDKIILELQKNDIEVRPLICGSLAEQPFFKLTCKKPKFPLTNATKIHKFGFYVPNHPSLTDSNIQFICDIINKNL